MTQLAECCNESVNPAIFEFIDSQEFLKPGALRVGKEERLEAIKSVPGVPDRVKGSAAASFDQIDMAPLSETVEVATARRRVVFA